MASGTVGSPPRFWWTYHVWPRSNHSAPLLANNIEFFESFRCVPASNNDQKDNQQRPRISLGVIERPINPSFSHAYMTILSSSNYVSSLTINSISSTASPSRKQDGSESVWLQIFFAWQTQPHRDSHAAAVLFAHIRMDCSDTSTFAGFQVLGGWRSTSETTFDIWRQWRLES